jgi:uncharacterized protein involved in exopolysaccharide biosynthesis
MSLQAVHPELPPWQAPVIRVLTDVARYKVLILLCAVLGLLAGVVVLLKTPAFYRATAVAVLLPRERPVADATVSTSSLKTAGDSAVRADSGALMLPPNPELYTELIYSRAVLEGLVQRFSHSLAELSPNDRSDEAIARLGQMITVKSTEQGIINITVTAEDRHIAAELANALLSECERASKSVERQLILQQAGYLESAVKAARLQSDAAQRELETFSTTHKTLDPVAEGMEMLRLYRESMTARETIRARLAGLAVSRTSRDPEVRRLTAELDTIDLRIAEARESLGVQDDGANLSLLAVEFEQLKQQLRFKRDLLATLEAQADIFQIRAEQPAGSIAVIRIASPAAAPAGPSKRQLLGLPTFGGAAVGVLLALVLSQLAHLRQDSRLDGLLRQLTAELDVSTMRAFLRRQRRRAVRS